MNGEDLKKWIEDNVPKRLGVTVNRTGGDYAYEVVIAPRLAMRVPGDWNQDALRQGIEGLLNALIGECVVTAHALRENVVSHTVQTIDVPQLVIPHGR